MSALNKIVIMGGVGGGQIATTVIEDMNREKPEWEIAGFLNDGQEINSILGKYPVVGRTEEAPDFAKKGYFLHYALHNAKVGHLRAERLKNMNISPEMFPQLIHPTAYTNGAGSIGQGVLMAPYVIISFGASVGSFCHLYGNCMIGHDAKVGDFVSVSSNAVVGGYVNVGEGCHIGVNCSIRENVKIEKHAIIGLGSVVLKDVCEGEIAVGNPSKIIGTVERYHQ